MGAEFQKMKQKMVDLRIGFGCDFTFGWEAQKHNIFIVFMVNIFSLGRRIKCAKYVYVSTECYFHLI